jgi:hypothetical protein
MKKRDILLLENGTKNIALRRKFNQNLIEAGGIPKNHEEYKDFNFGIEIETCFNSQYEKLMHDFGIASDFQEYHDDSGGWKEEEDDERYISRDDRKIQERASMKELTHLYGPEKAEKMQGEIFNVLSHFKLTADSSIECGDSIVPPHKLPFQNCHHISQHNIHRYQYDEDPTNIFRTIDNLDDPRLNKYVPIEFVSTYLFQYPLSGTFKEAIAFIQQHSQLCVAENRDNVKNAKRRLWYANVQAKMHTEQAYSLRKKRKVPQNIKEDIVDARKTLREGKLSKYKGSCGTHVHVSKRTTLTTDMSFLTTLNDFWVGKYQQRFMDKFYRAQDRDDNIYYARMNCGINHVYYDDVNKSVYGEDFQRLFSGRYRLLNLTPTFTDWENSWKNANGGDDAISMKQQQQHREKDVRPIHVEFRGLGELIDNTGKTRTLSIAAKQSIGHRLEEYMVHIMNFWLETEKVHRRSLNIYKTKPFRYFYDRLSTDFLKYLEDIPAEKNFHLLLSLPFGLQKYRCWENDYVACFQIYLVFSKNRFGRFRKVLQDFNVSNTDTNPDVFDSMYGEHCQDMIDGRIFKKVTRVRSVRKRGMKRRRFNKSKRTKMYYPTPQDKINYENMLYKDLATFPYQYSEMVRMFDHGYEDMIKNIRNTYAFHPKYKDTNRYVHSYYNITDGKNHAKIDHGAAEMGVEGGDEGQKDILNERYRIQNQIQ